MIQPGHTIKVLDHGFVRYVDHMGSDTRIVEAARISYRSPSKGEEGDKKLLRYLFKNKHTSPFEMCKLTLNVKMPIFIMRQWVRHRMQNLNEVSARYSELPGQFYLPWEWRAQSTENKQSSVIQAEWAVQPGAGLSSKNEEFHHSARQVCLHAYSTYLNLLEQGVAKEMARMVLPVNIYTEIYCCWDLNNLLKFLALRDDSHAQAEIQEYAKAIKEIVAMLFPWTLEVYEEARANG